MPWFQSLCRNTGLMIHNIIKPESPHKHEMNRRVEEKKVNDKLTLRRTTIEEIEIKRDNPPGDRET